MEYSNGELQLCVCTLTSRFSLVTLQNGSTALYRAAMNGHTEIVKLLLQTGHALVNVENNVSCIICVCTLVCML